MNEKKYSIIEIIPTALTPDKGYIAQISAIKLNGLELVDRFDYRLDLDKIDNIDVLRIVNYDNDKFNYVDSSDKLLEELIKFIKDDDILYIDNRYTLNYIKDIPNKKESVFKYLNMEYSDDIFDKIIEKYKIEPSNYLVDVLYEALIFESGEENGSSK